MPVFTAAAASIVTAAGFTAGTTSFLIAQSVVAAGLAYGAGKLTGAFDTPDIDLGSFGDFEDRGVEQRLGANTTNKVPLLYGNWMNRGALTYFEVSSDRQTLYAVITLGEGNATSIDTIYWDDLELTLDTNGWVTSAVDLDGNTVDRLNNKVRIHTYPSGGRSTYLEGESSQWTSSHKMTNLVYAVVTVEYDRDAEITGLADIRFIGTSPISDPSDAVKDLLENTRYGMGLPASLIDTASFTAAKTYYTTDVNYTDTDGATQTQDRFQVNGVMSTEESVQQRIESILKGSDSFLRWSNGKFGIFVNKADAAVDFTFTEDNILGNISVSETGMNNLINKVEINYGRNSRNNWQRGTTYVTYPAASRYPNEPDRTVSLDLSLTATNTEAERIATVLLNQARQQLTIRHKADITAMPLEAGDVVKYTDADYGWTNKLFRIISVTEEEENGTIQYDIQAVEYAAAVYTESTLTESDVAPNVNVYNSQTVGTVSDLMVAATVETASPPYITLSWTVPTNSLINSFAIYANHTNTTFNSPHTYLVHTEQRNAGANYTGGTSVTSNITGLDEGDYSFWVVARNDFISGTESNRVTVDWEPASLGAAYVNVYRFHTNLSTNDPGAPTGIDGTGGGWVEDTEAPVWEAVTTVPEIGGQRRIIDFELSGTGGDVTYTDQDVAQRYQYTFSGNPGNQSLLFNPRRSIATYTFSGESAEVATNVDGVNEAWTIGVTGHSDPEDPSNTHEFYLYPNGSTLSDINGQYLLYVTGDVTTGAGATIYTDPNSKQIGGSINDSGDAFLNSARLVMGTTVAQGQAALDAMDIDHTWLSNQSETTFNISGYQITVNDTTDNETYTFTPTQVIIGSFGTAQIIRFDHGGSLTVTELPSGDNFTWSIQSSGVYPTVTLGVTQDTISESYTFTGTDTNDTTIRDSIFDSFSTNTDITDHFTVTKTTTTVGANSSYPAILLTADDSGVKTVTFTETGSLTSVVSTSVSPITRDQAVATFFIDTDTTGSSGTLTTTSTGGWDIKNTVVTNADEIEYTNGTDNHVDWPSNWSDIQVGHRFYFTNIGPGTLELEDRIVFAIEDSSGGYGLFLGTLKGSGITPSFLRIEIDQIYQTSGTLTTGDGAAFTRFTVPDGQALRYELASITYNTTGNVISYTNLHNNLFSVTHTFSKGLANTTAMRNDLLTGLSANTNITNNFTVSAATGDIGSHTNVPYVKLVSDDNNEHFLTAALAQNGNTSAMLETGTLREGDPVNEEETRIRITFDSLLGVETVDIGLGDRNASEIATFITATLNALTNLTVTATVSDTTITLTADNQRPYTDPVITITDNGTSSSRPAFTVTNTVQGVIPILQDGTYTTLDAVNGDTLFQYTFGSNLSSAEAAEEFKDFINDDVSGFTATRALSVVTVTSTTNTSDLLVTTITTGINKSGVSLSSNDLAVVRSVTQAGSLVAVYNGRNSSITTNDGDTTRTVSITSTDTPTTIATALAAAINLGTKYTATASGAIVSVTSTFVGVTPALSVSLDAGLDLSNAPASLAVVSEVLEDGTIRVINAGSLSSYSISRDGTLVANGDFVADVTAAQAAMALRNALAVAVPSYSYTVSGTEITATSTFNGTTPDVSISVSAGSDTDGVARSLAITRTLVQAGSDGTPDLTNATWRYFVTSQEPRVDTDLLTVGANNNVTVRRGLVLDTTIIEASHASSWAQSATTHTTGSRTATLVIIGAANAISRTTTTADAYVSIEMEYSTDGGTTWTDLTDSVEFPLTYADPFDNDVVTPALNITATLDAAANTTFTFRGRRKHSNSGASSIGWSMLVLEELRAS